MRADQEVCYESPSGMGMTQAISSPELACGLGCLERRGLELHAELRQSMMESLTGVEVGPHLTPNDIAGDQRPGIIGMTEGLARLLSILPAGC